MKKTIPSGIEPYDKSYGLGYQKSHGELSPYPRVNRLRKTFLDREFTIDIGRARLVTETYQENQDKSTILKGALALKNVLENIPITLYDEELIVGEIAAPAKAAPVYPEFSADWIRRELTEHPTFNEREHDRFTISENDTKELLEILEFWKGNTLSEEVERNLTYDDTAGSELGKKVFMTNLYHYGGIGHFVLDYTKLLSVGFDGLLKEIEEKEQKLGADESEENKAKAEFYEAAKIELNAAKTYIARYAELAEREAKKLGENDARQKELKAIAENCNQIAGGKAQTFWQALQLWHFATTIVEIESNGHSVSHGRMDQWLYPYYENDIENGTLTKEFAEELLEVAFIKMGNPSKLKDRMTTRVRNGRGWGGESLTIGGVDKDGNDATNDLTFLMLEASVHTRLMTPWLCVRMHKNTPHELKVKTFECIKAGYGHPKLYNDETAIKVMQKKGMTLEEARDYEVVGCVEPDLMGKEFGLHDAAYLNMVRVLELSLNGGKCVECSEDCPQYRKCVGAGKTLGPNTGNLETAVSFSEVLGSFEQQLRYWTDKICNMTNAIDRAHAKMKPTPFASAMFKDCIESGKDLTAGGAAYNFTGPQACGIASVSDALVSIRRLIFEERKATGDEMLDALRENWEGHEMLYALVNSEHVPHFGNDNDYADDLYARVFNMYCKAFEGKTNPRGGTFTPGVYSVNANVGMGLGLSASLDGRKKDEPISDNMGPVHTELTSHDTSGPTAIANSVNKVDHSAATNGTLLNWKFSPQCVSGEAGRENLISFVDTYFKGSATHCQFNIMSSETMKDAMAHPENYRDMLVRVAGYSAYFVELSKPLQLDLIRRTELSF